jgi:O-acetyl-ADP-ribose deacetylase (regulator of RNase III)
MVEEIQCDIFQAPIDILVHQANCFHTMGSGIAREIRERFPEAYEADCTQTKKGDRGKLGTYSIARINRAPLRLSYIFNLYGQYEFGRDRRHTNYEAVYNGLSAIRNGVTNSKLVIGIPYKMSCNLAGGSWRIVETMIRDVFEDSLFKVLICKKD